MIIVDQVLPPDTAGAASMLPRDKGGVVDPTLKVLSLIDIYFIRTDARCRFMGLRTYEWSTSPSCLYILQLTLLVGAV
jgi:hypothetical protein